MYEEQGLAVLRQRRARVTHFGETLRVSPYSYRLKRHEYATPNKTNTFWSPRADFTEEQWAAQAWKFEDEDHRFYSHEYCAGHREDALENFDANMAFFRQLSGGEFLDVIAGMREQHPALQPVTALSAWKGVEGVYVMLLDRFKQADVGQAGDIRSRIMRHWSGTHKFDRLIFGTKETSVLSIDSFRALDTTRIYAAKTRRALSMERRLVQDLPADFLLNRVPGGARMMGGMFLPSEVKQRRLAARTSENHP